MSSESGIVQFFTMPPCPMQEARDQVFRAKRDAGLNALGSYDTVQDEADHTEGHWAEIKDIFGYNVEDEADNWWVQWGLLMERANDEAEPAPAPSAFGVEVAQTFSED